MPTVNSSDLVELQHQIENVRNICILAHVDHGKTTLADSLVASNGIISQRMAGKLRYLDNRPDEQERGITMKSSSITLYYKGTEESQPAKEKDYLINLIDSPGHVDFSSEVSTAVRLCDGAIIVVDVVEGVCPQTRACLQQTYVEQLKPVLVLNKIDRLILEKQMTALDAYLHIMQVLEQVNAVLGSVFASDVLAKEDITNKDNYESALEDVDDSSLYFTPSAGNVVFCSAVDGWAFAIKDFAATYAARLEIPQQILEQVLWGDFYYNAKKKAATPGAQEKAKKPMFVQFVLENIWSLYDIIAVRKDKEKLPVIAEKLGIKLLARDLRMTDVKVQLKTVMSQWLPIDRAILEMVTQHIPAPNVISDERAQRLLFPANAKLETYPSETLALKEEFKKCDASSENIIVFVSKMTPVHVSQLPQNKPKRLNEQELQARRDEVRKRIEERKRLALQAEIDQLTTGVEKLSASSGANDDVAPIEKDEKPDHVFIAFARIFSGTLKTGMKLYNLAPKHDPRNTDHLNLNSPFVSEVTVSDLYMFMGGELQLLDEVPAGNIVGIGGLENDIIKTATLSSTMYCTSFSELSIMATPILRVAIEAVNPQDMPKLVKGLKLLNQADACVQVSVARTGEHVITTLGEVHVEKCVRDLEERYAKIKVNVSEPIVSFRETIVPESKLDMVNEVIVEEAADKDISKKIVTLQTTNKLCTIRIIALPLPQAAVDLLEKYMTFFKELATTTRPTDLSDKTSNFLMQIKNQLTTALVEFDHKGLAADKTPAELVDCIWALGPRNCGTNLLLNLTDYEHPNFWSLQDKVSETDFSKADARRDYNSSFVNGFQLTTSAGPLCEEPMQGVCFMVLEWSVDASEDLNTKAYGPFSGQVLTAVKEACRQAFQNQPQRLVSPMYSCNIIVDAEMLGEGHKIFDILFAKRKVYDLLAYKIIQGLNNGLNAGLPEKVFSFLVLNEKEECVSVRAFSTLPIETEGDSHTTEVEKETNPQEEEDLRYLYNYCQQLKFPLTPPTEKGWFECEHNEETLKEINAARNEILSKKMNELNIQNVPTTMDVAENDLGDRNHSFYVENAEEHSAARRVEKTFLAPYAANKHNSKSSTVSDSMSDFVFKVPYPASIAPNAVPSAPLPVVSAPLLVPSAPLPLASATRKKVLKKKSVRDKENSFALSVRAKRTKHTVPTPVKSSDVRKKALTKRSVCDKEYSISLNFVKSRTVSIPESYLQPAKTSDRKAANIEAYVTCSDTKEEKEEENYSSDAPGKSKAHTLAQFENFHKMVNKFRFIEKFMPY